MRTSIAAFACLCLFASCAGVASAQSTEGNLWFVRSGATSGHILGVNPFNADNGVREPIHWAPNLTLEIGRRTDGSSKWHALYGTPSYGFGFSFVPLPNRAANSRPMEAYTFFSWPFAQLNDKFQVTTDFGMGLSWRWKHMNETSETYQNVLGSNLNARIDWGFYLRYLSTPRIALYTGIDYTHRSNGGVVQPDLGINAIGPKIALQYNFAPEVPRRPVIEPPAFHPAWEFVAGGTVGIKNVLESTSPMVRGNFAAFDVTAATQRHFYQFGKVAAGVDAMYDGSTGVRLDDTNAESRAQAGQRWAMGLYGGYEHVIGRFGALVQFGDEIVRGFANPNSTHLYSRYGWRYQGNDRVWGMFAIRTHGLWKANVLEFGVGYRVRRPGGTGAIASGKP